jgi:hypothetical protein
VATPGEMSGGLLFERHRDVEQQAFTYICRFRARLRELRVLSRAAFSQEAEWAEVASHKSQGTKERMLLHERPAQATGRS